MSRYFTRPKAQTIPRANYDDPLPMLPAITVDDHVGTDTGLIDCNGDCIIRAPRSIGFHADL